MSAPESRLLLRTISLVVAGLTLVCVEPATARDVTLADLKSAIDAHDRSLRALRDALESWQISGGATIELPAGESCEFIKTRTALLDVVGRARKNKGGPLTDRRRLLILREIDLLLKNNLLSTHVTSSHCSDGGTVPFFQVLIGCELLRSDLRSCYLELLREDGESNASGGVRDGVSSELFSLALADLSTDIRRLGSSVAGARRTLSGVGASLVQLDADLEARLDSLDEAFSTLAQTTDTLIQREEFSLERLEIIESAVDRAGALLSEWQQSRERESLLLRGIEARMVSMDAKLDELIAPPDAPILYLGAGFPLSDESSLSFEVRADDIVRRGSLRPIFIAGVIPGGGARAEVGVSFLINAFFRSDRPEDRPRLHLATGLYYALQDGVDSTNDVLPTWSIMFAGPRSYPFGLGLGGAYGTEARYPLRLTLLFYGI